MMVFENRVLRRIFEPEEDKYEEGGENFILRCFIYCALHQMFLG
jgi:hypothetical protein